MRLRERKKVLRKRRAVKRQSAQKEMELLQIGSEEALLRYCENQRQTAHNRLRACSAVAGLLGRAAVPFLLRLAADQGGGAVDAALHGLRCIGTRRATRLQMRALRVAKTDDGRQAALDALRSLGDRRSERLVSHVLLTDGCAMTRELAAEVLGYVHRGRRSARVLMLALSDPSPAVRWWALDSLSLSSLASALYPSDLARIREYLSDQTTVPGVEFREKATVAWAARHALEAQASGRGERPSSIHNADTRNTKHRRN
jgi:HEAT repeat protein